MSSRPEEKISARSQRIAVCPGSYDPITLGHVDVIARAAALFDQVIVVVLTNPDKHGLFSPAERVELLTASLQRVPGVVVDHRSSGLLADFCQEHGASAIIKGLRGEQDYRYEVPMAHMNWHLGDVETVFVQARAEFGHVSSSLIKDVARHGGDVRQWVPAEVAAALDGKFSA